MQITLYRASGHPIDNPEQYLEELNKEFDKLEADKERLSKDVDYGLFIQDHLTKWHNEYEKDHPTSVKVKLTGLNSINKLCEKYGAVAFCIEDNKPVCYILDK